MNVLNTELQRRIDFANKLIAFMDLWKKHPDKEIIFNEYKITIERIPEGQVDEFHLKSKTKISEKNYALTINTPNDEIMETDYCSFCEEQLKKCACFEDVVWAFKKRQKEIAWEIAQPIFDRVNNGY